MIICKKCERQTEKRETTGSFTEYYYWTDSFGRKHKDIKSQLKVCMNCNGVK